jgi:hypothetical protein
MTTVSMTTVSLTTESLASGWVTAGSVLAAEGDRLPEDVGKSGPLGLLLVLVLLTATVLLVRSMSKHLKKLPRSFDTDADEVDRIDVPDTPAELIDRPAPGQDVLDTLRRAPRAIEPPRRPDGRPADPA